MHVAWSKEEIRSKMLLLARDFMTNFPPKKRKVPTEWSRAIETLRRSLNLSQTELGKKLETSATAVSRWERGEAQPPADEYIRLGKLAGDPLCWFFWGRAGLNTADVIRVLPKARRRFLDDRSTDLQVGHAGAKRERPSQNEAFVAILLLPVRRRLLGSRVIRYLILTN